MFEISQNASQHLAHLLATRKGDGGLRLAIKKGGCAGFQYILSLDCLQEQDHVFECEGGPVFIDPESFSYLDGSTLEYEDGLSGTGFRIQNPQATRNCGCGTSFEINSPS